MAKRGRTRRSCSRTATRRLRKRLFRRQKGVPCFWCGKWLFPETATGDHMIPASRGGRDVMANIVPACSACNARRGNKYPSVSDLDRLSRHSYVKLGIKPGDIHALLERITRATALKATTNRIIAAWPEDKE